MRNDKLNVQNMLKHICECRRLTQQCGEESGCKMRSYPGKQQGRAQLRCPGAEGRERTDGWMEGLSRKEKVQMPGQIQGWRRTRPGSSPAQPQAAEERKAAVVDNSENATHSPGMASNHLVISKLQHLLENSSIADVHEEMTLSLMASPQEISLVHIRCFAGQ
ncbi:hypothetical protein AOLI_G00058730 [Acnodon oligacanthus]